MGFAQAILRRLFLFQYKACVGLMHNFMVKRVANARFQYKACVGLMLTEFERMPLPHLFQYKACVGLICQIDPTCDYGTLFQYKACVGLIKSGFLRIVAIVGISIQGLCRFN